VTVDLIILIVLNFTVKTADKMYA